MSAERTPSAPSCSSVTWGAIISTSGMGGPDATGVAGFLGKAMIDLLDGRE